jgi:hypothetical protein
MIKRELFNKASNESWACQIEGAGIQAEKNRINCLDKDGTSGWLLKIRTEKKGEKPRTFLAAKQAGGRAFTFTWGEAKEMLAKMVSEKLAQGYERVPPDMRVFKDQAQVFGPLVKPGESTIITKGDYGPAVLDLARDFDMFFALLPAPLARKVYDALAGLYSKGGDEEWADEGGQVGFALYDMPNGKRLLACFDDDLSVFGDDPDIDRFLTDDEKKEVLAYSTCHACRERCLEEMEEVFGNGLGLSGMFAF